MKPNLLSEIFKISFVFIGVIFLSLKTIKPCKFIDLSLFVFFTILICILSLYTSIFLDDIP